MEDSFLCVAEEQKLFSRGHLPRGQCYAHYFGRIGRKNWQFSYVKIHDIIFFSKNAPSKPATFSLFLAIFLNHRIGPKLGSWNSK
jgi:hypothetical protein